MHVQTFNSSVITSLKDGISISMVTLGDRSMRSMDKRNRISVSQIVVMEFATMSEEAIESLNSKISIPFTNRESRPISYECNLVPAHLRVLMLAASGYSVNSNTIRGVNDWIVASLWRSINTASLLDTPAGRWLGASAGKRTREVFCLLRGLSYPLESGTSFSVESPSSEFVAAMSDSSILRIGNDGPLFVLKQGPHSVAYTSYLPV